MSDSQTVAPTFADAQAHSAPQPTLPAGQAKRKRANMHEGIAVWCDCCSCEAEPRWIEVAKEMGIDLSEAGDLEPADTDKR